ncbi:restriction endonuclease subunit S [Streptomyces sp. NPDC093250]|uniref:restriction endonuclease subunit S n=1 Tax=Streptomyces sp. NPDC093250 TaxID=3366036 RepID=UPI0038233E03
MKFIHSASLGNVAEIRSGVGFPNHLQGRAAGIYPFAKVSDISKLARTGASDLHHATNYIGDAELGLLKTKPFPAETIVFAKIGEAIRQNFRAILKVPALVDNNVMGVIPNRDLLDPRYLYHHLMSVDMYPLAQSTTVPSIRKSVLEKLEIPLPPLPDQKRIVAILDQGNELRTKRRKAIAFLEELIQSIFLDMFGDPAANQRGWPTGTVGDLVRKFETGKNVAAGSEGGSKLRVLKVSAVTSGEFNPRESKPLPAGYTPPLTHMVKAGDLLFSRANTEQLIGAVALVEGEHEGLVLPDKLWRFAWKDHDRACPLYIRQLFRQKEFRRQIRERSSGTSGSMKNISQSSVLSIECGVPPLDLQKRFSERAAEIDALRSEHRAHLGALDELFTSLQQRAFSGALWDQEAAA